MQVVLVTTTQNGIQEITIEEMLLESYSTWILDGVV